MTIVITNDEMAMFNKIAQKQFMKELYQYCRR